MPIGFAKSILAKGAEEAAGVQMFKDVFVAQMDTAVTVSSTREVVTFLKYDDTQINTNSFVTVGGTSTEFTVDEAGKYLIIHGLAVSGVNNNTNVRLQAQSHIYVNNNRVYAGVGSCYIRNNFVGDNQLMGAAMLDLAANDVIKIGQVTNDDDLDPGDGGGGSITDTAYVQANSTNGVLQIIKMADADFCSLSRTTSTQTLISGVEDYYAVDQTEEGYPEWNNQVELDTGSFAHSTGTNPEEITLKSAGKYLVTGSFQIGGNAAFNNIRGNTEIHLESNDSNYSASGFDNAHAWSGNYLRNASGNDQMYVPFIGVIETADANSEIRFAIRHNTYDTKTDADGMDLLMLQTSSVQVIKLEDTVNIGLYTNSADYEMAPTAYPVATDTAIYVNNTEQEDTGLTRSGTSVTCATGKYYLALGNAQISGSTNDESREIIAMELEDGASGKILTASGAGYFRNADNTSQGLGGELVTPSFSAVIDATASAATVTPRLTTKQSQNSGTSIVYKSGASDPYNSTNDKFVQKAGRNAIAIIQLDI